MTELVLWWAVCWLYVNGAFLAAVMGYVSQRNEGRQGLWLVILGGATWPLWTPMVLTESVLAAIQSVWREGRS